MGSLEYIPSMVHLRPDPQDTERGAYCTMAPYPVLKFRSMVVFPVLKVARYSGSSSDSPVPPAFRNKGLLIYSELASYFYN